MKPKNKFRSSRNKSGNISPIYFIIAGLLMFILVSCTMGNAVMKAFKSYKGAEESFDDLSSALSDVSNKSNNLALKLVTLKMEEGTALFVFQKDNDLRMGTSQYLAGSGLSNSKILIEKPAECPYDSQCVCLCKEVNLKALPSKNLDEINALNAKYAGRYPGIAPAGMYSLECEKGIECKTQEDFEIRSRIELSEVISSEEQKRIERVAQYEQTHQRLQKFITYWEGGFMVWRLSDSDQKEFQSNQFMSSQYLDLYVVNENRNTDVKICLDPACGKVLGTP